MLLEQITNAIHTAQQVNATVFFKCGDLFMYATPQDTVQLVESRYYEKMYDQHAQPIVDNLHRIAADIIRLTEHERGDLIDLLNQHNFHKISQELKAKS